MTWPETMEGEVGKAIGEKVTGICSSSGFVEEFKVGFVISKKEIYIDWYDGDGDPQFKTFPLSDPSCIEKAKALWQDMTR